MSHSHQTIPYEELSLKDRVSLLSVEKQKQFLSRFSVEELEYLEYNWRSWLARPKQLAPLGEWTIWLVLAGRGWGKSFCGGQTIREYVDNNWAERFTLAGPTAGDIRDIMVEGLSGLMNVFPPGKTPKYEPSKNKVTFYNGSFALLISADEPERYRGKQHEFLWADELASWKDPDAWDQMMLGLRIGKHPRAVVTTTPKSTPLIRDLVAKAKAGSKEIVLTTGSTFENRANLAKSFFEQTVSKYDGTRLGMQEIYAELLEDVEGALWNMSILEKTRTKADPVTNQPIVPCEMKRMVVAVDPASSSTEKSDETGIIVAGLGDDNHGYVFEDLSLKASPDKWARVAVAAYWRHKCDGLVVETNNGGDVITHAIRTVDKRVNIIPVKASRGKKTRAEPISALYEQNRVHHVGAKFVALEKQMCTWDPINSTKSPDRMDALVWAMSALMFTGRSKRDLSNINLF